MNMISKVSDSYKHHILAFIVGPFLKMVEAIFDLLIPLIMKAVIDLCNYKDVNLISNPLTQKIAQFVLLFGTWVPGENNVAINYSLIGGTIIIVMGIIGFIMTMITQYIAARTAVLVGTEIRNSLYKKALSLSKIDKEKIGNSRLLTVINADSYQVQTGVLIFIRLIVRAPFIVLGALAFSFILDYRIGFVFLGIIPLILFVIFFIMSKSSKRYVSIQSNLDKLSVKTSDTIDGSKVIRAFNLTNEENKKFDECTSEYRNKAIEVNKWNSLINPLTFAIVSIATLFVTVIGSKSANTETVSTIIAEIAYLSQIFFTLVQLTNIVLVFTKANVSSKRCNEVLALPSSVINCDNPISKQINNGDGIISFSNVSLAYVKGANKAIDNISFKLLKGQSLGIIGGTGSGKSSIVSLIERFTDTTEGTVYYKGEDIKKYDLTTLRNEIGLVPQKSILFKGTIKSNMLMANMAASDDDIYLALKDAEAINFVNEYKDKLDHEVVEGGLNFSGGQRQRLCIARALLRQPEILIFDDSMSALDLLTDEKVRTNIKNNYSSLTKIIVSQRVATIKDCDLILVLDGGKILQIGNHDYLLKNCSTYKEIYETQVKREDE